MRVKRMAASIAGTLLAVSAVFSAAAPDSVFGKSTDHRTQTVKTAKSQTATPIKHIVVLFDENVSFDHYFGTYPNAANSTPGEPTFSAKANTPSVNGLTGALLSDNPNSSNPQRLSRSQAMTPDMNHSYSAEQKAYDGGKMDQFVQYAGNGNPVVMNYYDGNTVTALWNYAQNFSMSDNSYNTTFGPSTPGALNLVSGQTHGMTAYQNGQAVSGVSGQVANGTVIADPDPYYDSASKSAVRVSASGKNIGDLLNSKGITWGWFQGGFRNPSATHVNIAGTAVTDYSPHHEPFQYYQSTANPNHLAPSSVRKIGYTDRANHQYDLTDFWTAANKGSLPAVSFLKAGMYQDGHAGYSDPLDEQNFIVTTINKLQKLPQWKDTAVVIAYDDSDGWYDHVAGPLVNGSNDLGNDALFGLGNSGTPSLGNYLDRAGYGPRLPLLVISSYAKTNYVDHTLTDQTSILRFIEDNWKLGKIGNHSFDAIAGSLNSMFNFKQGPKAQRLFLDPATGKQVRPGKVNKN
ncbi:phospholipase C [Sporolactobacillus sp. KGMB 08714]|uniref:phospholipase C n=1 Tax=Sporolactobacillus sp. KGMB 08714 TaxID=3064704 RepID=UPI002FBE76FD